MNENLFKTTDKIGGGTAGALRAEGLKMDGFDGNHDTKAKEMIAGLNKLLSGKSGETSADERELIVRLKADLQAAQKFKEQCDQACPK